MPEFILNTPPRPRPPHRPHPFYDLDTFARGYVEAMFFTNGDCGDDENEHSFNDAGVERLTRASVKDIKHDCDSFIASAGELLDLAYLTNEYDDAQAGRDFWFTRQGHGVGFWDRDALDLNVYREETGALALANYSARRWEGAQPIGNLGALLSAAKKFGEANPYIQRGWIYYAWLIASRPFTIS